MLRDVKASNGASPPRAPAVPMSEGARAKPRGVAGDAFGVLSATVVALGFGFVTSIVVARLLGPDGRGLLGVAYSVASIAVAIGSLGVPVAIAYYASRRPRLLPRLLGSALLYTAGLFVVLLALAVLLSALGLGWSGESRGFRLWGLTALLTWALMLEFIAVNTLRAGGLYRRLNSFLVVSRATILVLTILLVAVLDLGSSGALLALAGGSFTYAALSLPMFVRRGIGVSRGVFGAMIGFGWRVQVGRLIQIGNGRLDVLVLSVFAPLSTVGIYVVAQVIAELVMLVPTAIGFVALPAIARGGADAPDAGSTVRLSGTLSLIGVLGVAVVGPALIYVGYGSAYGNALWPLYILLPGVWLFGAGNVIGDILRGRGRPGLASVLAGVAIVVTVVLDVLLIPRFGAVGAAIASTCAYAVYGLTSAACLGRAEGIGIRQLLVLRRVEAEALWRTVVGRVYRRGAIQMERGG